jgi:8-oxo-dGTP diphosphatase
MTSAAIDVVAGVLRDDAGRVLLAQRPAGKDHAGLWEFPGGKVDAGETPLAALARELLEELGIELHDAQPIAAVRHDYPGKAIRLHAWQVQRWTGEPQSLDGQSLAWVPSAELDDWPMPTADRPLVTALRLPTRYAITPEPSGDIDDFCTRFERLLAGGARLVQLRSKQLDADTLRPLARRCAQLAQRHGADLLINDQPALAAELGVGLHLSSALLRRFAPKDGPHANPDDGAPRIGAFSDVVSIDEWLPRRHDGTVGLHHSMTDGERRQMQPRFARGWLAASCHDAGELALAARIGCDFATLSPVHATASHPDATALGWAGFARLAKAATMPVFALGGMAAADEPIARNHGARGIAAIRAFWPD